MWGMCYTWGLRKLLHLIISHSALMSVSSSLEKHPWPLYIILVVLIHLWPISFFFFITIIINGTSFLKTYFDIVCLLWCKQHIRRALSVFVVVEWMCVYIKYKMHRRGSGSMGYFYYWWYIIGQGALDIISPLQFSRLIIYKKTPSAFPNITARINLYG
jgi:hypothetical protein